MASFLSSLAIKKILKDKIYVTSWEVIIMVNQNIIITVLLNNYACWKESNDKMYQTSGLISLAQALLNRNWSTLGS